MECPQQIAQAVQSAQAVADLLGGLPPNRSNGTELVGKVNEVVAFLRSISNLGSDALEAHQFVPILNRLKLLLPSVDKFARYLAESVAEGLEEGLDTRVRFFVHKLDNIMEEMNELCCAGLEPCRKHNFPANNQDEDWVIDPASTTCSNSVAIADAIRLHVQQLRTGTETVRQQAAVALLQLVQDHDMRTVLAEAGDLAWWVELLDNGTEAVRDVAARAVRRVTFDCHNKNRQVVQAGAVPRLVHLLSVGGEQSKIMAAAALGNLALTESTMLAVYAEGAIYSLTEQLREDSEIVKEHVARALSNLADYPKNRDAIATAGAIPLLVQLLRDAANDAKETAAAALTSLAYDAENREPIAAAGAIPRLVQLLRVGTGKVRALAAGTLRNLAVEDSNDELIVQAGAIPLLVQLLRDGAEDAGADSAGALWNLICTSTARQEALQAEDPGEALQWLLQHGSEEAKETAAGLLAVLGARQHHGRREELARNRERGSVMSSSMWAIPWSLLC
jgi:hypothetical protein